MSTTNIFKIVAKVSRRMQGLLLIDSFERSQHDWEADTIILGVRQAND